MNARMNKQVRRALHTNARYQVLIHNGKRVTSEDWTTKAAANKRITELTKQGVKATLWDSLDNSLSALFAL